MDTSNIKDASRDAPRVFKLYLRHLEQATRKPNLGGRGCHRHLGVTGIKSLSQLQLLPGGGGEGGLLLYDRTAQSLPDSYTLAEHTSPTCLRPIFLLSHICLKFQKKGWSHFWQESLSNHSGVLPNKTRAATVRDSLTKEPWALVRFPESQHFYQKQLIPQSKVVTEGLLIARP